MNHLSRLVLVALFLGASGCGDTTHAPPASCDAVTCGANASCVVENDAAVCHCDTLYTLEGDACINAKEAECADAAPANATSELTLVTITWDATAQLWSEPAACTWTCDEGYVVNGAGCVVATGQAVPLAGFGAITGECGTLNPTNLGSASSSLFVNSIDFGTNGYDDSELTLLSDGGQVLATTPNAGGSSVMSEVFAYEVLYRCELAGLIKTETQISYDVVGTSLTDMLVSIDDLKIGVSVTRAMSWPRDQPYPLSQAVDLLTGKLQDIQESNASVSPEDQWVKQILHVIADTTDHVTVLEQALAQIDPAIIGDTLIVITVTEGMDDFIY